MNLLIIGAAFALWMYYSYNQKILDAEQEIKGKHGKGNKVHDNTTPAGLNNLGEKQIRPKKYNKAIDELGDPTQREIENIKKQRKSTPAYPVHRRLDGSRFFHGDASKFPATGPIMDGPFTSVPGKQGYKNYDE